MCRDDRTPPFPAQGSLPAAERIAIGIVLQGNSVLVGRREHPPLAGYSEFPGGKVRQGETPERAVAREIREECDLDVQVERPFAKCRATHPYGSFDLHFFLCRPRSHSHTGQKELRFPFEWIPLHDLPARRFPPANADVLHELSALNTEIPAADGKP